MDFGGPPRAPANRATGGEALGHLSKPRVCLAATLLLVLAAGLKPRTSAMAQAEAPVFALEPNQIVLGAEPVRVELTVVGAPASTGFSVDVLFDSKQVAVTGVVLGDWPGSTGRPVQPLGPNLDQPGRLVLGALMVGDAPAPEGDGVLAVLTLSGLADGTSKLTLSNALLVRVGENSEPLPALTEDAAVIAAGVPAAAAAAAVAAASALAAAPNAGLVPDFVDAVSAQATNNAPQFGAAVPTAVASFTPAVVATPVASSPSGSGATPSGRTVVLAAVIVGITAFLWVFARRRP